MKFSLVASGPSSELCWAREADKEAGGPYLTNTVITVSNENQPPAAHNILES